MRTRRYIYNVASAVPLYEWTAVYTPEGAGNANPGNGPSERQLGTQRWTTTSVDHVFEVPPERISTSSSSGATYRHVLSAASDASPWRQAEMVKDPADRSQLVMTHARWDDTNSAKYPRLAATCITGTRLRCAVLGAAEARPEGHLAAALRTGQQ